MLQQSLSEPELQITGRIIERDEAETEAAGAVLSGLTESGGEPAIIIAPGTATEDGDPILFTQKDLREIQLAKAAVAAGIRTLVARLLSLFRHKAGVPPEDLAVTSERKCSCNWTDSS